MMRRPENVGQLVHYAIVSHAQSSMSQGKLAHEYCQVLSACLKSISKGDAFNGFLGVCLIDIRAILKASVHFSPVCSHVLASLFFRVALYLPTFPLAWGRYGVCNCCCTPKSFGIFCIICPVNLYHCLGFQVIHTYK